MLGVKTILSNETVINIRQTSNSSCLNVSKEWHQTNCSSRQLSSRQRDRLLTISITIIQINVDNDFKNVAFSGAHDATVAFVASGKAEVGVLNASVWEKLNESKSPNALKSKVLSSTPSYFDYNWTVRGDLEAATVKKIADAFLKLDANNPAHKELMDLQRASKYIATKPSNYNDIEKAAKSAGLIN